MKRAFVYYLEFTNDNSIYIKLLVESINRLIKFNYCKGSDIFVNVVGYSGTPIWVNNKYEIITNNNYSIWKQLTDLSDRYKINIIDVSEDRLHYVELPILVDIPLPQVNDVRTYDIKNTSRLKLFNHKFTSYMDIIEKGYDRVVQLDADLLFYAADASLFDIPYNTDPDQISYCRFTCGCFFYRINDENIKVKIQNQINSREHNMVKLFSLCKYDSKRNQYQLARNFIKGILNYDLDNFVNDLHQQDFWIHGGLGIFDKPFIEKHFQKLSFINYFLTKDDEIALMIYCFANQVTISHLDPSDTICCSGRNTFDNKRHVAYHPQGDSDIKIDFINNNWIPV